MSIRRAMKLILKITIGIFALIGAVYVGFVGFVYIKADCISQVVDFVPSPNGESQIQVLEETCGDEHKSIRVVLESMDGTSEVFKAIASSNRPLLVSWNSDRDITINSPASLEPSVSVAFVGNVNIDYQQYQ